MKIGDKLRKIAAQESTQKRRKRLLQLARMARIMPNKYRIKVSRIKNGESSFLWARLEHKHESTWSYYCSI